MIYLGADHRGYELKETVKSWLIEQGYEVEDLGAHQFDPDDDYVDYGLRVAESIEGNGSDCLGLLFCGSGHGMDIVANRFPNVRAILGFNDEVTVQGKQHENANILVLPADHITSDEAVFRIGAFIATEFSHDPRHERRIAKIGRLLISNKG